MERLPVGAVVFRRSADGGAVAARGGFDFTLAGAVSPAAAPVPVFSLVGMVVSVAIRS
jgi:hypothetical protein